VSKDQRNRLFTLARTLRRFGLTDKFGLNDLVGRPALPSRAKIARSITESSYLLPPGISAAFLAEHIARDLEQAERGDVGDHEDLQKLIRALPKIPKGNSAAIRYQMAILAIFRLLFQDRLGEMKPEVTVFSGTKRIDIWAENDQEQGFFNRLRTLHALLCPAILFECKNYKKGPGNPEFDQLLGRLNNTSTFVGFVVCRQIDNIEKARQRCKEGYLRERKLMMWLTDADVHEMVAAFAQQGPEAVDMFLKTRLERVTLK
jgi:hypothetical protein